MTDAGFFRGTSAEQDNRFSDKEKKLLKQMKFNEVILKKVDMKKIRFEVIKPWITDRILELLGMEDDVLADFVINQLEANNNPDGRKIQINLTGFLNGKNARVFTAELWELLISGQENPSGIPTALLDAKKEEIRGREALESIKKEKESPPPRPPFRKTSPALPYPRREPRSRSRSRSRSRDRKDYKKSKSDGGGREYRSRRSSSSSSSRSSTPPPKKKERERDRRSRSPVGRSQRPRSPPFSRGRRSSPPNRPQRYFDNRSPPPRDRRDRRESDRKSPPPRDIREPSRDSREPRDRDEGASKWRQVPHKEIRDSSPKNGVDSGIRKRDSSMSSGGGSEGRKKKKKEKKAKKEKKHKKKKGKKGKKRDDKNSSGSESGGEAGDRGPAIGALLGQGGDDLEDLERKLREKALQSMKNLHQN